MRHAALLGLVGSLFLTGCPLYVGNGDDCTGSSCTGRPTTCRTSGDCSSGDYCSAGSCTPSKGCSRDDQCSGGLVCDFRGTCVPREGCRSAADCLASEVYVEAVCHFRSDACQFDFQCGAGRACVNSGCVQICMKD